ncbi:FHA domain-containing protein [Neobacillus rhizosphaerae]|uniref:FHA domain-containing protein n=1 Tax=Neobacillus rhizosphaerae TaxID=2880965 RepID=UPI003D292226
MGRTTVEQNKNDYIVVNRLAYPEAINERELRAIAGGVVDWLIPVTTEKTKKGVLIQSTVEDMISLKSYFSSVVSKKMFLDTLIQLAAIVKACEKNLMNVNNLMLDWDYIFLDPRTKKVKCLFWPIVNNQQTVVLSEFFRELPFRVVFSKHEDARYVASYIEFFKSQVPFSINQFEKCILGLMGKIVENKTHIPSGSTGPEPQVARVEEKKGNTGGNVAYNPFASHEGTQKEEIPQVSETSVLGMVDVDGGTTVLGADLFEEPSYPYVVREKTQEKITINRTSFRIGKERQQCDYVVSDNNAVSRNHADILTRNGRYYIVDNGSTNKTFVDGRVIPVEKEREIFSGTKLRLANEDFVFYI